MLKSHIKFIFLSRPRRFGKTMLCSTLEQLFMGNKELFKDLYIYNKFEELKIENDPIIYLDFSSFGT